MINCIAVDDEPLALAQISNYISKVSYLRQISSCHDAFEAIKVVNDEKVDLMFVDINMPGLNGMDFVKSLNNCPKIIFTTAYSEYAIEGFKVEAVDYLLKPFSFQEFLAACERAKNRIESENKAPEENTVSGDYLFVKNDYRISRIDLSDIKYIESMGEYVRIFLDSDSHPLMPLLSMKRIEDILPSNQFMRVHRSFIVNLSKVKEISKLRIVFGNVYIPIGDSYKNKFLEYINSKAL